MKGIEQRFGEFVVATGDGAADLEIVDHALDAVVFAIDPLVPAYDGTSVGLGRDGVAYAVCFQLGRDSVGIVALVGEKIGGLHLGERDDVFERRATRGFAGREVEGEREASGIAETMNFASEPAPLLAKNLFASPLFASAAET